MRYRPPQCPYCQHDTVWRYGTSDRKAHREPGHSVDHGPVEIQRFRCAHSKCRKTCSTLPECIPPRRWYLWIHQQAALSVHWLGWAMTCLTSVKPSQRTIQRWRDRLVDQWSAHTGVLCAIFPELGRATESRMTFWQACFEQAALTLSRAMWHVNQQGIPIP
jgi:hypothetical protein